MSCLESICWTPRHRNIIFRVWDRTSGSRSRVQGQTSIIKYTVVGGLKRNVCQTSCSAGLVKSRQSAQRLSHRRVHQECLEGVVDLSISFVAASPPVNSHTHADSTLCLKKVPTIKLSVTLSDLNRCSKFLQCCKAYEICYKTHITLPTSP